MVISFFERVEVCSRLKSKWVDYNLFHGTLEDLEFDPIKRLWRIQNLIRFEVVEVEGGGRIEEAQCMTIWLPLYLICGIAMWCI